MADGDPLWGVASDEEIDGLCDGVMEELGDSPLPMDENDKLNEGELVGEADGDPLSSMGVV